MTRTKQTSNYHLSYTLLNILFNFQKTSSPFSKLLHFLHTVGYIFEFPKKHHCLFQSYINFFRNLGSHPYNPASFKNIKTSFLPFLNILLFSFKLYTLLFLECKKKHTQRGNNLSLWEARYKFNLLNLKNKAKNKTKSSLQLGIYSSANSGWWILIETGIFLIIIFTFDFLIHSY